MPRRTSTIVVTVAGSSVDGSIVATGEISSEGVDDGGVVATGGMAAASLGRVGVGSTRGGREGARRVGGDEYNGW